MGTRDRILDAAAEMINELGVARATTKEIARAADCSEALLYKYFSSKEKLFKGVMGERMPILKGPMLHLRVNLGENTLEDNLVEYVIKVVTLYREMMPMAAGMFADPALLAVMRASFAETGAGPHNAVLALGRYLAAEQELGRLRGTADPDATAALLLGACFHRAFFEHLVELSDDSTQFATSTIRTLLT